MATVDAAGNLHVSVSNQPSTQQISGSVSVTNFPTTQQVSGTVSTSPGRTVVVAQNFHIPTDVLALTNTIDTSDCRSIVGMHTGTGFVDDVTMWLAAVRPDGGVFNVSGTRVGAMWYFTVGGTNLVTPRAGFYLRSNTDQDYTVANVWLFCGH